MLVPGWVSNLDVFWEEPRAAAFLQRLASFSRLILFDKRGTGLSDRVNDMPTLEQRMDDVRAVMDAARSPQAALVGYSEGGPMCMLFAATHPERTAALIMFDAFARRIWAPDYPWGPTREEWERYVEQYTNGWGGPVGLDKRSPTLYRDARFRDWWARFLRSGCSPGANRALMRMNAEIDVRHVLPAVRVPTLVIHNDRDGSIPVACGRYMAERIGARVAALAGAGEILVSNTVRDLVAGSGLRFEDRGVHALKGVPGEWHLFAVGKDNPS